jgi:hypothetical protein
MPLFRLHRGELRESLKTTIIVKTLNDVVKAIVMNDDFCNKNLKQTWGATVCVKPYPNEENNFDTRIGWYTHAVLANIYKKDEMVIIGFLSEPLKEI